MIIFFILFLLSQILGLGRTKKINEKFNNFKKGKLFLLSNYIVSLQKKMSILKMVPSKGIFKA